ncbi:MAG TPA: VOC family protein [Pseudonocardia sp.]|jgi:catechol 2,3-dioxygenase-like lactoylglutathione lyase family enzyme
MIDRIDHLVLTVQSVDATCEFYRACLGFIRVDNTDGPTALHFGRHKLNIHQADHTFDPTAQRPTRGSADFCLITTTPLEDTILRLTSHGASIELGPIDRDGATGRMRSVYFRDPDGNLVEVSQYYAQ